MKRGMQFTGSTRSPGVTTLEDVAETSLPESDGADGVVRLREHAREREPLGAFDARAFRELSKAVPANPRSLRRTLRRNELRQIVPLADSTIYELERRGEFPKRFFLTPRCVVWDLAEVEAWLQSRRRPEGAARVKKAPTPDYRQRGRRNPV